MKRCKSENIEIENWTTNTELLCRDCSEGIPHQHGEESNIGSNSNMNTIAFACESEESLVKHINEWSIENNIEFDEFLRY